MAVALLDKREIFSDNIVIGFAELKSFRKHNKTCWALPGGYYTTSRPEAMRVARRMDTLIRENMKRLNRSLI